MASTLNSLAMRCAAGLAQTVRAAGDLPGFYGRIGPGRRDRPRIPESRSGRGSTSSRLPGMSVATTGTPTLMASMIDVGQSLEAAGQPQQLEMRHQPHHVVALAKKVYLVLDLAHVAKTLQVFALRAVADDQQMDVVANYLEQVGRPDQVFDPLLMPQPADGADQAASRRAPPARGTTRRARRRDGGGRAMPLSINRSFSGGSPCVAVERFARRGC